MKKKGMILVCLILLVVLLSGWSLFKKKGSKQVEITIWDFKYGEVGNVQDAMKKIDDLVMQQNPNIKINHVSQPKPPNYYQLVRAAAQANQGPDIVMFHGGVQAYEFDDYTAELDKYIKSWKNEISNYSWDFCSEGGDGKKPVHLVPLTVQGFGIYYNKAYFKKAGLNPDKAPSDYASFMDACEKLKKAGIAPITTGLQGPPFGIDFLIRTLVANIYGKDVKELVTGKENFKDNKAFLKAVDIVKELFDKGYIDMSQTSVPYFVDAINNYKAGKGAMFIGLLSDIGHWKDFNDSLGEDNIGYFPTINFSEAKNKNIQVLQPCGIGYSIMKWSKNKDEAAKVIEAYARGEGNAIWMGMTGALSPNKKMDIKKLGYPLVGQILKQTFASDFNTLLTNEDANQNMDRYIAQYFVSKEITKDKFIASFQKMLDNVINN